MHDVPAHFLFAASFGYAMGLMKAPGKSSGPSLLWGWGVAAIAHGAYDFMIFGAAILGDRSGSPNQQNNLARAIYAHVSREVFVFR